MSRKFYPSQHDLLEILEQNYGRRSTIATSQLPSEDWHRESLLE
jgi:hypothetical protein